MPGSVLRIVKTYQCLPLLLAVLAGLVLTGCSQPENIITSVHTLNQRIASTLDTDAVQLSYSPRPAPLPAVRQLKPAGQPVGMSLLTSLRLGHCNVGQQIAQRNSALGRLEDGLMRLQGDIKLLQGLKECIKQPKSAPLVDELQRAIEAKSRQLQFDTAHALATDKALRNALDIGAEPLQKIDPAAFNTALDALTQIVNWLQQPGPQPHLHEWREQLAQSDYLNRLSRSVISMRLKLRQLQAGLPPLTRAAGCDSKGVPQRAKVLRNVFMQFFINDVQADLALLTTQFQQYQPLLRQLADISPQPALAGYLVRLSEQGEQLSKVSKSFVQPWQEFFANCGFTPGED